MENEMKMKELVIKWSKDKTEWKRFVMCGAITMSVIWPDLLQGPTGTFTEETEKHLSEYEGMLDELKKLYGK